MSRLQTSSIIAIVLMGVGIFASSRLKNDLDRPWVPLRNPPKNIGSWMGIDDKYPDAVYEALRGSRILLRRYEDPTGAQVALTIISSPFLDNFHNPTFCYMGAGFDEASNEVVTMKSADGRYETRGSLIVMQNAAGQEQLLYGWYVLGHHQYSNVRDLKFEMAKRRFGGGGAMPAYFVSVVTVPYPDKERATRRIERFVEELLPYVDYRYAYKRQAASNGGDGEASDG